MSEAFYPSCVAHIQMSFEKKLNIREDLPQGQFRTSPLATQDNNGTFVMNRVPKKMTCHFQGHTQAATWTLVFDYKELPIDPRTVVASTVEIYLGTVSAEQFRDGMKHEWRPGVRRSILQTRDPEGKAIQKDLLLVGPVDSWKISYEKDGSEVHLEGRDLRGILLDSPLVSQRDHFDVANGHIARVPRRKRSTILNRLDTKKNIVDLVQQILGEHDRLRELAPDIEVVAYKDEWPDNIILSPGAGSHIPRHRRGAGGAGSNPGTAHEGMNFWDLITRYCYLCAAVPRFVGRRLEIRYAPTLYSMVRGWNNRIPFANGEARNDGKEKWFVRRAVYGRDVESMSIERKYSGNNKPKTVRCVVVDRSSTGRGRGQMLEAVWPPRNTREARREGLTARGAALRDQIGGTESSEILNIPVFGVRNLAQLVSIAQSYYEQIGRQEMKAEVNMDKVTSFGGDNADPDMLRMRVGDPLELLVDARRLNNSSAIVATLNRTASMTFAEAVEEIRRVGTPHFDENLARAIVASARGNIMGVLRYFRVGAINYDWGDEGVSIKADLQNYWTPTYDENARIATQQRGRNHADRAGAASNPIQMRPNPATEAPAISMTPNAQNPDAWRQVSERWQGEEHAADTGNSPSTRWRNR
jgi:hypothetical protein